MKYVTYKILSFTFLQGRSGFFQAYPLAWKSFGFITFPGKKKFEPVCNGGLLK